MAVKANNFIPKGNNPGLPQARGEFKPKVKADASKLDRGIFEKSNNATKATAQKALPSITPDARYAVNRAGHNTEYVTVGSFDPKKQPSREYHSNNGEYSTGAQAGIDRRQNAARARQPQYTYMDGGPNTNGLQKLMAAKIGIDVAAKTVGAGFKLAGLFMQPGGAGAPSKVSGNRMLSTGSSDGVVGKMKSAQTPAELRSAIGEAEAKLSGIPQEKSKIESEMKQVYESKEAFNEAKKTVDTAISVLRQTRTQISNTQNEITQLEKNVDIKTDAYKQACTNVSNTKAALDKAEDAFSKANPDDPNYSQIKQDVIDARQEYAKALEQQKAALEAKEQSGLQLTSGEQRLKDLLKNLAQQEKQLANQEKILKENADSINKYTKLEKQLEELNRQEEELPCQIEQYEEKLKTMVEENEQAIEDLNAQKQAKAKEYNQRAGQIDERDGLSKAEKKLQKQNAKTEKEMGNIDSQINTLIQKMGLESMKDGQQITFDGHMFTKMENGNYKIDSDGTEYTLEQLKQYIIDEN